MPVAMSHSDTMFIIILVVLAIFCYCQSDREKFEPGPPCPFRPQYDSPDSTPGPDLKAIADASLLATPPAPSPLPELYTQRGFMPELANV